MGPAAVYGFDDHVHRQQPGDAVHDTEVTG
jgi:hypothetical protein